MGQLLYRHRDFSRELSLLWIWAEAAPPWGRFMEVGCPDGSAHMLLSECYLGHFLEVAYERQVRDEMVDPEWPNAYWESVADNMAA